MPFKIVRNDITKMKADAIVNSANPAVCIGDGVDAAIHAAAGPELFAERELIGEIPLGSVVATRAFSLRADYVFHTVGPVWCGGQNGELELVQACYRNALALAVELSCKSIAFPLISTGTYGFPKDQALQAAISVISEFLLFHELKVFLVVYDRSSYALSEKLFNDVTAFIDDRYIEEQQIYYEVNSYSVAGSLDELMDELEESFSQSLLRLIDEKEKTDAEIYKKANLDRKLFSKIRRNKDYQPSKATAIAFALALELNFDETMDLIGRAGFTLSRSTKFDLIIQYFILHEIYNVFEINEVLFAFDQILLGS